MQLSYNYFTKIQKYYFLFADTVLFIILKVFKHHKKEYFPQKLFPEMEKKKSRKSVEFSANTWDNF